MYAKHVDDLFAEWSCSLRTGRRMLWQVAVSIPTSHIGVKTNVLPPQPFRRRRRCHTGHMLGVDLSGRSVPGAAQESQNTWSRHDRKWLRVRFVHAEACSASVACTCAVYIHLYMRGRPEIQYGIAGRWDGEKTLSSACRDPHWVPVARSRWDKRRLHVDRSYANVRSLLSMLSR
jgi:hypothetical protein